MRLACLDKDNNLSSFLTDLYGNEGFITCNDPLDMLDFPDLPWVIDGAFAPDDLSELLSIVPDNHPGRYVVTRSIEEAKAYLGHPCSAKLHLLTLKLLQQNGQDFLRHGSEDQHPLSGDKESTLQETPLRPSLCLEGYLSAAAAGLSGETGQILFLQWISTALGTSRIALFGLKDNSFSLASSLGSISRELKHKCFRLQGKLVRTLGSKQSILARPNIIEGLSPAPDSLAQHIQKLGFAAVMGLETEGQLNGLVFFAHPENGALVPWNHVKEIRQLANFIWQQKQMLPETSTDAPDKNLAPALDVPETLLKHFALRTANEFKNTLVPIKTFTQLLPEKFKDAHFRKDFFKVMSREVYRLEELIDSVGFFSSSPVLDPSYMDLNEWVSQLEEGLLQQYPNIRLQVTLPDSLPPCEWDNGLMSRAMKALLKNAAQAMEGMGIIHLRVQGDAPTPENRMGSLMHLILQDEGPGPDQATLKQLFHPLFSTRPGGLGLGLAMVKTCIEAHGGTIEASARPSGGMEFHIQVPMQCTRNLQKLPLEGMIN